MKNKKLYITLFALSIIFLGIGGTFAYLTVNMNATNITQIKSGNMTMTIDGGGSDNVTLFPATCTSDYAIKKTIKASAVNTSGGKVSFSIGMNIATLSDGLKRSTMKYALTTSATSCTDGLVASGNFSEATVGSDIWLIKNDYNGITNSGNTYTKTYYLYIWLDQSETENLSGSISVNMKGTSSNNPNLTTEADIEKASLYDTIRNAADTTTQIDFSQTSAASSTNGIYMTTDTEGNAPVYYYRGDVDNHLIFANFCWRIVRTTETGGVKLVYDGIPDSKLVYKTLIPVEQSQYSVINDEGYPFVYDNSNKTWKSNILNAVEEGTDGITSYITLSGLDAGSYQIEINMNGNITDNSSAVLVNGDIKWIFGETDTNVISLDLTSSDIVTIGYLKGTATADGSDYVEFGIKKGYGDTQKVWTSCNNTESATTIGDSAFNSSSNSPAYIGYMYGTAYTYLIKKISSLSGSIVFGNDVTYTNGNYTLKDTYTLTDVNNWSSEYSTIASKYHYTCFTSDDICENVNYMHYANSSSDSYSYYFKLSDGKKHLDILKEMLDNSTNENDSAIKATIDTWYQNNMTDYTSQLEDTVFCNDRSYDISKSSWNKDYSSNNYDSLYFNSYQRIISSKPTLMCANANDKFTVEKSNGNGVLDYPVGLLTADEVMYAGATTSSNRSFYLYSNKMTRLLTPFKSDFSTAGGYLISAIGSAGYQATTNTSGIRPVISLKKGTVLSSGSGTATDPFIVN